MVIHRINQKINCTIPRNVRITCGWVLVAHDCNPSYSGSRDQEDHGLKPALSKQITRLYLKKKKNHHKKVLVVLRLKV
jgi:hypothetical protein